MRYSEVLIKQAHAYRSDYDHTGRLRWRADDSWDAMTAGQVLEMLAGGMTLEDILRDFPYLEKADIDACLEYAARHAAHREISVSK